MIDYYRDNEKYNRGFPGEKRSSSLDQTNIRYII